MRSAAGRPRGAGLQLPGGCLVGALGNERAMPGPRHRIVDDLGQRLVRSPALAACRQSVDDRARERMAERDGAVDADQAFVLRRIEVADAEPETAGGPLERQDVASLVRRCEQEHEPCRVGQPRDPGAERCFHGTAHRRRA